MASEAERKQWIQRADDRVAFLNKEITTARRIAVGGVVALIAGASGTHLTSDEIAVLGVVAIVIGIGLVLLMHRDLRKAKQRWYEAHKAAEREQRRS
jgi:hypothetical protein